MKRDEREHVLRTSAATTRATSFVVIGSQAVLLPHSDSAGMQTDPTVAWARRSGQEAAP